MKRTTWSALAVAVLLLAGCADGASDGGSPTSGEGTPTSAAPTETAETPEPTVPDELQPSPRRDPGRPSPSPGQESGSQPRTTGEVPREILDKVLADAADRAGVSREQVEVIRAQAAQWRDGSLGCPRPGEFYTQAIVDGYWVVVHAAGQKYDYRLDGRGNFRLCEQPHASPPPTYDR